QPFKYFPLHVLVHVTEAAGNTNPKRGELVRATADMLRFRVTPQDGAPAQLPIPLEHLLKPLNSTWTPPLEPGKGPIPPPDTEYVTHRGFLEAVAFWMNLRNLLTSDGRSMPIMESDPWARLKKFYEYRETVGELLFNVTMPKPASASP